MQSNGVACEKIWDPLKIFRCPVDYKYAFIVLNQPIHLDQRYVLPVWQRAQVTVTVDGGTNQWIEFLGTSLADDLLDGRCSKYLPTLVTGDMDSILPDILGRLESIGANVIYTPDTIATDFTKALIKLRDYTAEKNIKLDGIHVLVETAGRLDQIMANVNTLYISNDLMDVPVIQIAGDSLTWLLKTGRHKITIPDVILKSKSWCALLPFGDSSNCITTTGLKWNLNNTCMKFGGLISTSNTYSDQPQVSIETDKPIVWTMGIEPLTRSIEP